MPPRRRPTTPANEATEPTFVSQENEHTFEVVLRVKAFGKVDVLEAGIRKTLERVLLYALPNAEIVRVRRGSRMAP